jgi:hypothetical protein
MTVRLSELPRVSLTGMVVGRRPASMRKFPGVLSSRGIELERPVTHVSLEKKTHAIRKG